MSADRSLLFFWPKLSRRGLVYRNGNKPRRETHPSGEHLSSYNTPHLGTVRRALHRWAPLRSHEVSCVSDKMAVVPQIPESPALLAFDLLQTATASLDRFKVIEASGANDPLYSCDLPFATGSSELGFLIEELSRRPVLLCWCKIARNTERFRDTVAIGRIGSSAIRNMPLQDFLRGTIDRASRVVEEALLFLKGHAPEEIARLLPVIIF